MSYYAILTEKSFCAPIGQCHRCGESKKINMLVFLSGHHEAPQMRCLLLYTMTHYMRPWDTIDSCILTLLSFTNHYDTLRQLDHAKNRLVWTWHKTNFRLGASQTLADAVCLIVLVSLFIYLQHFLEGKSWKMQKKKKNFFGCEGSLMILSTCFLDLTSYKSWREGTNCYLERFCTHTLIYRSYTITWMFLMCF